MEDGIIPIHPSATIYSGSSGSGKSNLSANLLQNELFYKKYFDIIFLFAGSGDSLFNSFGIENKNFLNVFQIVHM